MGGQVEDHQVLFASATARCSDGVIVLAAAGSLEARCLSGEQAWARRYIAKAVLWGIVDLDADGEEEFLATSVQNGVSHLEVFSVGTGEEKWSVTSAAAGVGEISIGDVDGDGRADLVWSPAASSIVRAYSFCGGYAAATVLWQTQFLAYVSDPYTASLVAIGPSVPGRGAEVIISGGRHEFAILILDGLTGQVRAQQYFFKDAYRLTEGGGAEQFVALRDLDGDGQPEIVIVSGYSSDASYMFQGALVAQLGDLASTQIVDNHPYGWEFVDGSLRDFDDHRKGLVVSRFNQATSRFVTQIIDLPTLGTITSEFDARLRVIIDTKDGPVAIVQRNNRDESLRNDLPLSALRIDGHSFAPLDWETTGEVVTAPRAAERRQDTVNAGRTAVTVDVDGTGSTAMLLKVSNGGTDSIRAVDVITGEERARYETGALIMFVTPRPGGGIVVALRGGRIAVLDDSLAVKSIFDVGGFYRSNAGNGHGTDPGIVADLDGNGVNELYINDVTGTVNRIDLRSGQRDVIWQGGGLQQDLIGVDGTLMLRACKIPASTICRYSYSGDFLWATTLPFNEPRVPIGLNIGRFGPRGDLGVIAAGPPQYPMTTYAVALDGRLLWQADRGTYWDATFAIADFNHDGIDDVVYNYNSYKAFVINGVDGSLLTGPVTLPIYRKLGQVDYNGAPMIVDVGADGVLDIVDVEDDGHVALFRPDLESADPQSEIVWSIEQAVLDDERQQMPAAAPDGTRVILGCGSNRGMFMARDAATGNVIWERQVIPAGSPYGTALTKSLAIDVNGSGAVAFVVGGEDGLLHALDARTGNAVWSVDLGVACGDPIAADVDGDGFSEILVTAADGWLYLIDDLARQRAVSH